MVTFFRACDMLCDVDRLDAPERTGMTGRGAMDAFSCRCVSGGVVHVFRVGSAAALDMFVRLRQCDALRTLQHHAEAVGFSVHAGSVARDMI